MGEPPTLAKNDQAASPASGETEITLGVLSAVEENSTLTQRSVAQELGIALGLANAYLKRCVKKGLIKVKQVPPNRYAYYLTPQGFAEKSRLTAEYLSSSFTFFRRARAQCEEILERCETSGWRRIALAGTGDLAEIAILFAREFDVEIVGLIDPDYRDRHFHSLPVAAEAPGLGAFDAVIVTDLRAPQQAADRLTEVVSPDRLLAPAMLRLSPAATASRESEATA